MIKELWNTFPRLLEQRINGLLDEAEPSAAKAFQLYKACQRESVWMDSFEKFSDHLNSFFAIPRSERKKSHFDTFLDRPMSTFAYEGFDLDFRTAAVNEASLQNLSNWAHNLMRVGAKTDTVVISADVISKTLQYITHPPAFEKAKDLKFEDFCAAWKKTVFRLFGKKYDAEFQKILNEIQWLQKQLQERENHSPSESFFPTIYLTQTEIDWTTSVLKAAAEDLEIPKFPLSRGPEKQRLVDLERTISLYKIVQKTKLEDFIKHRDSIKATILDRCQTLLKERAR